jgi:glyoxylase-like metal-dependent hydrolase (beta-lactamase superfamily II)
MRVHHLNTGTLCPPCALLVNGRGGLLSRARLVCHCLLLETDDGLALVDTGLGLGDIADPARLERPWLRNTRPQLNPAETAIEQVRALGFSPKDVRHLLLTHLDRDHAGGVNDFPWAQVHVHAAEYGAAVTGSVPARPGRYIRSQWAADTEWRVYGEAGEDWFGFAGVRALGDRNPDVLIIPLPGHTPGHCGVAVRSGGRWLLHAGDAYFHRNQMVTPPRPAPLGLRLFQKKADTDTALRAANQERLRRLAGDHAGEVTVFNSHDPDEFDRCRAA